MSAREKRKITLEDLYRVKLLSGTRISPYGENVIYSIQRVGKNQI